MEFDVAIIGGGPAGSTVGALLAKYKPELKVLILERERFPRDHIGESLLPPTSWIIDEMGCWDDVEAAGFPIKIGAAYRWGRRPERWNFDFYPTDKFVDEARPAKFAGQRLNTAFQVDRSIYDTILLDHAQKLGCTVRQQKRVVEVQRDGDRVTALTLDSGESVTARYYVDASGNSGILRRAMEIACDYPSTLRNIAIYDYWQNAEWAVEIGVGGTRIQVLSLGYGWIWFIPLGPTRTSVGVVVPVDYYKSTGKSPQEVYDQALADESIVRSLLRNASSEGKLQTTRDWSFLAERQTGENWFLVGECAGFADPILSAGVTMAHVAAQQLACTILELERGAHDPEWLRREYERRQTARIRTHIHFGDYWYTANEQFVDLKQFTTSLASNMGLELSPEGAWDWIARGGFIDDDLRFGVGGFSVSFLRTAGDDIFGCQTANSPFEKYNLFKLNLRGAIERPRAEYRNGAITLTRSFHRGDKVLPIAMHYQVAVSLLQKTADITTLAENLRRTSEITQPTLQARNEMITSTLQALESMIIDGWVECLYNPSRPRLTVGYNFQAVSWDDQIAATR
jgi:flavin-dependent dehydrogenase